MVRRSGLFVHGVLAGLSMAQPAMAACNISGTVQHVTRSEGTKRVYGDASNLFFTSSLAVNTDGAVTSYHPDDPWGSKGKAINTICNGANVATAPNQMLDYRNCTGLVTAFNRAKANGFPTTGYPRVNFYAVATKNGRPCTVASGPHQGYFVSTTSLAADPQKDVCDPGRYLDSLSIPFTIYPNHPTFVSRGVKKGTVVVTLNPRNGVVEYAIVGDRGPKWGLAEGSVFLAKSLAGTQRDPTTRREVYRFALPKVHTLMLPGATIAPPYSLEKIRSQGKAAFDQWGGMTRLQDCVQSLGQRP